MFEDEIKIKATSELSTQGTVLSGDLGTKHVKP